MEIFEGDSGSRVNRLEVINTGRRRRFTEDEKLRIIAESFAGERPCVGHGLKVIETVREKFTCGDCQAISQPPAPFHATPR